MRMERVIAVGELTWVHIGGGLKLIALLYLLVENFHMAKVIYRMSPRLSP